ncbi:MAG: hypothetical protein SPJ13_00270 [Bacteroidales bacterium]|nr:hypothetical protein [Bacteroidales bacterium]
MKKLILTMIMLLVLTDANARSVRYFTYPQAMRTVSYLNEQRELMIYCGYPDEIETYVLLNEVWAEKVNSKFYEIWLYGWDAYTGEEIYMPISLECIWFYRAGRYYNAAQYLRFRTNIGTPTFVWAMPPYNPYTRGNHVPGHGYTYHWDIHQRGWRPPYYGHSQPNMPHYHPYYYRDPRTHVYPPERPWTPGVDQPVVPQGGYRNYGSDVRTSSSDIRTPQGTTSTNVNHGTGNRTTSTRQGTTSNGTTQRGNNATSAATSTRQGTTSNGTTQRGNSAAPTATSTRQGTTSSGTTRRGSSAAPTRQGTMDATRQGSTTNAKNTRSNNNTAKNGSIRRNGNDNNSRGTGTSTRR